MKPDQLYQELRDLAEKLDIKIKEKSFRHMGIKVQSGLCKVRGDDFFIMDKNLSIQIKSRILAACLSRKELEDIFMVPALRDYIKRSKKYII